MPFYAMPFLLPCRHAHDADAADFLFAAIDYFAFQLPAAFVASSFLYFRRSFRRDFS